MLIHESFVHRSENGWPAIHGITLDRGFTLCSLSVLCPWKRSTVDEKPEPIRAQSGYQRLQHFPNTHQPVPFRHGKWFCCQLELCGWNRAHLLHPQIGFYAPQQDTYRLFCIPPPRHDFTFVGGIVVSVSYLYYMSRVIDLLDTIFFVLRKKDNQVTFLHVYHHVVMVLGCYTLLKFQSGGGYTTVLGECQSIKCSHAIFLMRQFSAFLNSIVHVMMYSYYFLTNYKPELRASLWWKRYITQVQLLQFTLLCSYSIKAIFFTDCDQSKIFAWYLLLQSSIMLFLFSKFYYQAYVKQQRLKSA